MSEAPTIADMTAAYSLDAVDHAQARFQIGLDFTPGSVERVEEMLSQLHEARPKGFLGRFFGPSKADIETMAKMYGSYVGEVIRREGGGAWTLTDNGPALAKSDAFIWPIAKVYKRLMHGSEENVAVYFKVLLEEHWPKDEDTGGAT